MCWLIFLGLIFLVHFLLLQKLSSFYSSQSLLKTIQGCLLISLAEIQRVCQRKWGNKLVEYTAVANDAFSLVLVFQTSFKEKWTVGLS